MKTQPQERLLNAQAILFEVSAELCALAYLFETQGTKVKAIAEFDMDQISHGFGLLLKRQVRRLHRVRVVVEKL
jgi:hypothetical protein